MENIPEKWSQEQRSEEGSKIETKEIYTEKIEDKVEAKDFSDREKIEIKEKLRKEIEETRLNPELEKEAQRYAQNSSNAKLDTQGKMKHLLDIAMEKGVPFAVAVAKNMQEPYLLDSLHDALVENELYKKLEKK